MSKCKIVIEVFGGNVQAVYSDENVEVVLVDWDNISEGDKVGDFPVYPMCDLSEETENVLAKH